MCGSTWLLSLYTYNMTGLPSCTPLTVTTTLVDPASTALPSASASVSANESISALPSITGNASVSASASASITANVSLSASASASISPNVSASASVSASITAAPSPSATTLPSDESEWYSLGCAVDSEDARVLTGWSNQNWDDMTVDSCLSTCEDQGYQFAGTEYGKECYCGSSISSTLSYTEGSCGMPCAGDSTEDCGGDWAVELYELISGSCDNSTATGSQVPSLTNPVLIVTKTSASASSSVATASAVVPSSAVVTTSAVVSSAVVSSSAAATTAAPSSASAAPPSTTSVPVSSDEHVVWAHHMVGNTYPYGVSDWASDVSKASSYGIDGFALNMGSDWWQPARISDAYTAAEQSGTGFKMFLSLDMTVMACGSWSDANTLVNLVKTYASHPNQAMRNGKVLVSTFAGSDCTFGTGSADGWQHAFVDQLTSQGVSIFFVPSVFSDPSTFQSNSWMDGELNWNSAWPMNSADITTDTDNHYISALGSKEYMAAISPFFYTHFGASSWNKNWLYRSDNWLYATRWEQLIAMRQQVKSLEILTWNDYGESSYIGPIHGALPAGSEAWTNGLDHEGINVLTKYYSTAFKTGAYPAITEDTLVMWQRPHPHNAVASNDPAGQPTGWNWTDDNLYAVVLTTGPAQVTLTSGGNTQTFSVSGGLSKLKIPAGFGGLSGSIVRNGNTVASYASSGFSYTATPQTYNFNYYLGSSS